MPAEGLFAEKAWRWSPKPFPLAPLTVKHLEALGNRLARFQRASNSIYHRSRKGTLPSWIAEVLDRGKPADLLEVAHDPGLHDAVPGVIRPDLVLTEEGFALTELDSVPGGIGLTAWLGAAYAAIDPDGGDAIVGKADGMVEGFRSLLSADKGADIVISRESGDYRPEMEWLAGKLGDSWSVVSAEGYQPSGRAVYRFFELFDLPNLPGMLDLGKAQARGELELTAPFKPWFEEKAWSAIFWLRPLRQVWRRELRDSHWRRLQKIIPYSWLVNPEPIADHAVIPRLEIQDFSELKSFSQTERDLVLKISGFSELAWGSRSVNIGSDQSQEEWASAVDGAISTWDRSPWVLQEFRKGRLVRHPFWNEARGEIEILEGRVRLCPYYFIDAANRKRIRLGGVLATICPADKKILHGMSEAILVPCAIDPDGY
ncbi:MAG: hypothetical protein KDN19_19275 [Verrucomicrobiae bacterium]|nr:hypothetical protein [Verrucomicrobiae bacterium]